MRIRKNMHIGAVLFLVLEMTGCIAIRTSSCSDNEVVSGDASKRYVQTEVVGVQPLVRRTGDVFEVNVQFLGTFVVETTEKYIKPASVDTYISCGLFPGVMSCKGEYADCLPNAAGAFFYNLVFAGLPSVYGLVMEPFIPHYMPQSDCIVDRTAFLRSPIIGFSRYSKGVRQQVAEKKSQKEYKKILLENVEISAVNLELKSEIGQPLRIPVDQVPGKGVFRIKFSLSEEHPLKKEFSDFENAEITVHCKKQEN